MAGRAGAVVLEVAVTVVEVWAARPTVAGGAVTVEVGTRGADVTVVRLALGTAVVVVVAAVVAVVVAVVAVEDALVV